MQNPAVQLFRKILGNYSISRKSISQSEQYLPIQEAAQRIIEHCIIRSSVVRSIIVNEKIIFQILVAYIKFRSQSYTFERHKTATTGRARSRPTPEAFLIFPALPVVADSRYVFI